jgi:mannose-6-phosphate isomerase
MKLYPLQCRPLFKSRIWGGTKLHDVFGKTLPADQRIGESWELVDLPNDKTVIDNGPLAGLTLSEVLCRYPHQITGHKEFTGSLPLLIKFIDAREDLSVQVHPDAQTCQKMGKGDPKTECWYILQAEPGAAIYKGVKPGTTLQQFRQAVQNGTCAELLERVPVQVGECHFLPSGTCHAIGAGLLIAEIQQPSDTTSRVFDWNRVDSTTGKPRQLHIEEAMQSIRFDLTADKLPVRSVGCLVDADEFQVYKRHQVAGAQVLIDPGMMKAVVFLTGHGQWMGKDFQSIPFKAGDTFLVPAAMEGYLQFLSDSEYLVSTVRFQY